MTEREAAEHFWAFALSVYGRGAAREAFLRLQDRDGADVPMLLWCLWCADRSCGVSRTVMAEAEAFSGAWRGAVVGPIRASRRALKSGVEGVPAGLSEDARSRIATMEQSLERMQMDYLAGLPADESATGSAALIALYASVAGLTLAAEDVAIVTGED